MTLDWLEFDYSEDAQGHGSFDAMASAAPAQWPALEAEVVRVLAWAEAAFGAPAPLEEGGDWDRELQCVREVATTVDVHFTGKALELQPRETGAPRLTLGLTLSGTPAFCEAFRQAFAIG